MRASRHMYCLFFVLFTLTSSSYGSLGAEFIEDPVRMPGWKGELPMELEEEVYDSRGFGELGEVR